MAKFLITEWKKSEGELMLWYRDGAGTQISDKCNTFKYAICEKLFFSSSQQMTKMENLQQ